MSAKIKDNLSFFRLLLETSSLQRKALLDTLSESQVNLISELVFNLLYVLPIQVKARKSLQRKTYLKDIAKIKRTYKYRKSKIRRNRAHIIKLLEAYKQDLLGLVYWIINMEKFVLLPHNKYKQLNSTSAIGNNLKSRADTPLPIPPGIPRFSPNIRSDRQKEPDIQEEEEAEEQEEREEEEEEEELTSASETESDTESEHLKTKQQKEATKSVNVEHTWKDLWQEI